MKKVMLTIIAASIVSSSFSQTITEKDFKAQFDKYGVDGCFVLFNQSDNVIIRYNSALCDSGYIPASTFKIPNSVIALEEGVVKDTNQVFKWNGQNWPNAAWNRDQTLKTAIKYSCIWVYFEIAKQIGIEKYYDYVRSFDYGNKDLTGPPTRFWLAGKFRISANQQIEFLKKFYNYQLPVSRRSIDIVKDMIVLDQADSYKLSGKTGGGMINDNDYIMWLVGYVEKDNKPYFYAMNFKTQDYDKLSQARYYVTKEILKKLQLID
jgi:beta-lactamase class D